jgi:hypothetical protein
MIRLAGRHAGRIEKPSYARRIITNARLCLVELAFP